MKVKTNLDKSEVSIEIDLVDMFGRSVRDEDIRQIIADQVIETIQRRTLKGFGVENGRVVRFKKYSPKYAKLKGQSNVDLELSGSMLNSISVIKSTPTKILIGISNEDAPKAHGHMTGQEGKGPLPRRSFLGLTSEDLSQIKSKYKTDVEKIAKTTAKDFQTEKPVQVSGFTKEDVLEALRLLGQR